MLLICYPAGQTGKTDMSKLHTCPNYKIEFLTTGKETAALIPQLNLYIYNANIAPTADALLGKDTGPSAHSTYLRLLVQYTTNQQSVWWREAWTKYGLALGLNYNIFRHYDIT